MKHFKTILFLGDSYCASLHKNHYEEMGKHKWQVCKDTACYPSLVADHYNARLLGHGYSGKSWWYSRSQFELQLQKHPALLEQIDAMIFCHTDWNRINTDVLEASTLNNAQQGFKNFTDNNVAQAQNLWFKYLYDDAHQRWSMQNWFRELSTRFKDKPQIHFHGFDSTVQYNDLLIGQRFITPLSYISIAELTGTVDQIHKKIALKEDRANHLSELHNQRLAEIIIDALDNYHDSCHEIDMTKFEIVNRNYKNFPCGNFGTE